MNETHICENCGQEHDGSYGSGRFCSKHCCSAYLAKKPKIHKRSYKRAPYGTWKCERCNLVFETRAKLQEHNHVEHPIPKGSSWNKGLTKETDERVKAGAAAYRAGIKAGKFAPWCKGKKLPAKTTQKISQSMKKAHAEGRAHNIGESRWNNEPSYPEKWFMKVIANEFDDKNYVREFPFHRFSLDFAWVDKKKCIEIDGEQHQRFEEYKERDTRKTEQLHQEGWKLLRLVWKEVYADPQRFIELANSFIGT